MRMTRIIGILLIGILLILGACAPTQQTPTQPAPAMTALVKIISDPQQAQALGTLYGGEFSPVNIAVSVGGTVTWNNTDNNAHSLSSDDGLFNQLLLPGESFSYTFTQNGSFNYHDPLYATMKGTVIVE